MHQIQAINKFFISVLKSPTQIGVDGVINLKPNISCLGPFNPSLKHKVRGRKYVKKSTMGSLFIISWRHKKVEISNRIVEPIEQNSPAIDNVQINKTGDETNNGGGGSHARLIRTVCTLSHLD
jgi:hypothetical protein